MREKKHLILLYDQLATLLSGGVSLPEAIAIIAEDGEKGRIQHSIAAVAKQLKEGSDIVTALIGQPAIFPELIITMVKHGSSGKPLAALFAGLGEELDSSGKHRRRLLLSLLYPGAITFIAILLILVMLGSVIPVFSDVYSGFGMALPTPTKLLLDARTFLGRFWILFVLVIVGGGGLLVLKPEMILRYCAQLPVLRKLLNTMSLCTFCRLLSILCRFDLSAKEMMVYAAEPVINPSLQYHIKTIANQAAEHEKLAAVLNQSKILPPLFRQMTRVGEKASSLSESFSSLAIYYDKEAKRAGRRLILIVDILAIVFVAFLVSSFVLAMYFPLFQMATVIG